MSARPGRNDACSCGSGRKYKHCCLNAPAVTPADEERTYARHLEKGLYAAQHGDAPAAVTAFREALSVRPTSAAALVNLGNVLLSTGDFSGAIGSFRQAIALQPKLLAAHCGLGNALKAGDDFAGAVAAYEAALALDARALPALANLSTTLLRQGRLERAHEVATQALALAPDRGELYGNLGSILRQQGRAREAVAAIRQAITLGRNDFNARTDLLFALSTDPDCSAAEYLAQAQDFGQRVAAVARPYAYAPERFRTTRPLRVGLVSGDLRRHPVGYFLATVLAAIDTTALELHAYPTLPVEDEVSRLLRGYCRGWHTLAGLADGPAAARIHADEIDVLIDLAGHTAHNRLPLFAWKSAPLQMSWLGYFASTGVGAIDYVLGDAYATPPDTHGQFTERVHVLPETRLCFSPPAAATDVAPTPALANGAPTFGCFQNLTKITDDMLAAWSRILVAVPTARLLLRCGQLEERQLQAHVHDRLARVGIAPERVTLSGLLPREAYLAGYADVDVMLDTAPFPGGTTTCEALYMGVPTVTLRGHSMLSNQGLSLLANAGLADWVAADIDGYVTRAVSAVADPLALNELRLNLRACVLASPLFDAPRFARHFESALATLWQRMASEACSRVP